MNEPEVIVAADRNAGPLTAVKGMLLQSSFEELKALGHEAYASKQNSKRLAELTGYLGGEWVPTEAMRAHYAACDELRLTSPQLEELGRRVGSRLQSRLLTTLSSTARLAGFNPWTAVSPLYRMAGRVFQGSSAEVLKLGPKELQQTVYGNPLCEFEYFRVGYCGLIRGTFEFLGARIAYVKVTELSAARGLLTLRVSWV